MTVHEWLMSLKVGDVINVARHNVTLHELEYHCSPPAGYPKQYRHLHGLKVQPIAGETVKLVCRCCGR